MSAVSSYRRIRPVGPGHGAGTPALADEMWPIDDHPHSSSSTATVAAAAASRFDASSTLRRAPGHGYLAAPVPKRTILDLPSSSLDQKCFQPVLSQSTHNPGKLHCPAKCQTLTSAAISQLYPQQHQQSQQQQPQQHQQQVMTSQKYLHPLSSSSCSPSASPSLTQHSQRHTCMPARHTMHPPSFRYAASVTSVNSAPHIITPTPSVSRNGSFYTDPPKVSPFSSLLPLRRFRSSSSARSRRRARRKSRSPAHDDRTHRFHNQCDNHNSNHYALSTPGLVERHGDKLSNTGGSGDGNVKFRGRKGEGTQLTSEPVGRNSVVRSNGSTGPGLRAMWGGANRQRRQARDDANVEDVGGGHTKGMVHPCQMSRQLEEFDDLSYPVTLQGYCRMTWFARLRCTRYLRLIHTSLHCYDAAIRTRLWVVQLHGARVRIHMPHKIVLSKLQCGIPIEFYVYDEQSCKHWAAALLHASSLSSCTSAFATTAANKKVNKSPTDSSHLTATSTMSCHTRTTPSSSSTTSHSQSPSPSQLLYRARPVQPLPAYDETNYYSSYGGKF